MENLNINQIKACCSNCSEQSPVLIQFCEAFLCQACLDWLDEEPQDAHNPSPIGL